MKIVFVVSLLLALAFWGLYQEENEEKKIYHVPTHTTIVKHETIEEKNEIFTSRSEKSLEINNTNIKTLEEKKLFIETDLDINVTRDNPIRLTASLKNANEEEASNYFWRENGQVLAIGTSIEPNFSKGSHIIELTVKNGEQEVKATIKVVAWDYKKVQRLRIENSNEHIEILTQMVYDHKNRLIQRDSLHSNYQAIYNEKNQKVEVRREYHHFSKEDGTNYSGGSIRRYTYNQKGVVLTIEKVSLEEESLSFEQFTYDEKGVQTSYLSGIDRENLIDYQKLYGNNNVIYVNSESNVSYSVPNKNQPIVKYNEKQQIIYREHDYGYVKESISYEYDEDGKKHKSTQISTYEGSKEESNINLYDKVGNTIFHESIQKEGEEVLCHYNIESTYLQPYQIHTKREKIIDGDCTKSYIKDSFQRYSYEEDGAIKEILSLEDNNSKEPLITFKTLKFYSNTLEME